MSQERTQEARAVEPPPGSVADLFREVLPSIQFSAEQTPLDVTLTIRREDLPSVMQAAKEDPRLAFDFLRCLSGVDTYRELEVVYHLYSFKHGHTVAIKVRCPYEDPHVPTMSHLWHAANWHEREAHEMFGIIFDGHPDLRPLLTEERLGYYPLRKEHPLAEIEEWQEDYLKAVEELHAPAAAAGEAPVDEQAAKVALAQKKAAVIKKAREEARAKGLSREEEKAAVQEALRRLEEEEAKAAAAAPTPAARPTDDRAAKVALAQKKAAVIKKAREEARARGMSPEEERQFVAEALKALAAEERE